MNNSNNHDEHEHDEADEPAPIATRATRRPSRATMWDRIWTRLERPQARPVVAIGLTALIAIGGLMALSRTRSETRPRGQAAGDIPTVVGAPGGPGSEATTPPARVPTLPDEIPETPPSVAPPADQLPPPTPDPSPPTPPLEDPVDVTVNVTGDVTGDETGDAVPDNTPPDQTEHDEQLLFWNENYVGYWQGDQFVSASPGAMAPAWLVGTELELRNQSGSTVSGTVVECQGDLWFVSSAEHSTGIDAFWYSDDAPFTPSEVDTDDGEQALMSLLVDGIPTDHIDSVGAPLAADGSADRLLWEVGDWGLTHWIATYDIETNTIQTVVGEAGNEPDIEFELEGPNLVWLDLDNDANLESLYWVSGQPQIREWATGDTIWTGSPWFCEGGTAPTW